MCRRLDSGGTERHLVRVLPLLGRAGIEVGLFVLERGGVLENRTIVEGVRVTGPWVGVPVVRQAAASVALFRQLKSERPDVVHFFLPEPYLVGLPAAVAACVPYRLMSRRSQARYQKDHPLLARIERWFHRGTTLLIGNSRAMVDDLLGECGDPGKVALIYSGVEVPPLPDERARLNHRRALGIPADALVFMKVANLIPYKGHSDLLAAFAIAKAQLPTPWRLVLVGRDEGVGHKLREQAVRLGLDDYIVWAGERDNAADDFNSADVAVLASHEEAFSNALLEAMSRALPVIATAVGGNVDAVADSETGRLVPPGDPQVMAAALIELGQATHLRRRWGAAGRVRVEQLFSLERCVARYAGLYRWLAAGMPPSDPWPLIDPLDREAFAIC